MSHIVSVKHYDGRYYSAVVEVSLDNSVKQLWVFEDASVQKDNKVRQDEMGWHLYREFNGVGSCLRPYVVINEVDDESRELAKHIALTATCRICEETINDWSEIVDEYRR